MFSADWAGSFVHPEHILEIVPEVTCFLSQGDCQGGMFEPPGAPETCEAGRISTCFRIQWAARNGLN